MGAWLGPTVASWSFGARMLSYSASWAAHAMFIQLIFHLLHTVLIKTGYMRQERVRSPTCSTIFMAAACTMGWFIQFLGVGAVLALYNPTPSSSWKWASTWYSLIDGLIPLVLYQGLCNFVWDTWYYHAHRYLHINKTLYRLTHKFHHRSDAVLNVLTSAFFDPVDSLVVGAPMTLVAYVACFHLDSYWCYAAIIHGMTALQIVGHTGVSQDNNEFAAILSLLIAPTMWSQALLGCVSEPGTHALHHLNPLVNFSLFSTIWDDIYGTAKPARGWHPMPLWILDIGWTVIHIAIWRWGLFNPRAFFTMQLASWLVPNQLQSLIMDAITKWFTRMAVWDYIRSQYLIAYAPKGTPGALEADPSQRYIFCYHPQNIIARGAWYTFAGLGKESPLAALPKCRLAVGRVIMGVAFSPWCFRAMGCCSSSFSEMKRLLTDKKVATSVAITPDGFKQGRHLGSYDIILNKRRGFVRLAHETGAALVPVVGVGEPDNPMGSYVWGASYAKCVAAAVRRGPGIKVVFGPPVLVKPGESLDATHQRYVAALLALGKAHGVSLSIVD